MAAVKLQSKASLSSETSKRRRDAVMQPKSEKLSPEKKPKHESPIVTRRSLRARGMAPEIVDGSCKALKVFSREKISPLSLGPLSMTKAHDGAGSHQKLVATLLSTDKRSHVGSPVKEETSRENLKSLLDLGSMKLEPNNIAKVVPDWIMDVKFLPCSNVRMTVVGGKLGNVGFWHMDSEGDADHDGNYLYRPHTGPISGILFQESCCSKIFTSCYHGYIRMMDAEKEEFILVHKSEESIYCLSRPPNDDKSLYFGDSLGGLTVWDEKMGKPSSQWCPHDERINTIHFNPRNPNIMATSSTDGTARIWDLRNVRSGKPRCLKMVSHKKPVNSAYFSPSGDSLATTSLDNHVGIQSGTNFEGNCMIPHINQNARFIAKCRAIWGWDDSYIFISNMQKAIDVISPAKKGVVMTLKSADMKVIPCRFDAHPHQVGMLAGASGGGKVYVWTSS